MEGNFEINILDKINIIEDGKVKKLCQLVVEEAIKNIHEARSIAVTRTYDEVSNNIYKISEGDY